MTNIRSIVGSILVAVAALIGGWTVWRTFGGITPSASQTLTPLTLTADKISTTSGLAILSTIQAEPAAAFELPVPRPDEASVGKQNLFQ